MAGWISSKLKVAENLLQQIDQQAAESLRKNEKPRSDELNFETLTKTAEAVPLKNQLKKKTPETNDLIGKLRSDYQTNTINNNNVKNYYSDRDKGVGTPVNSNPKASLTDSDWTELLNVPKKNSSLALNRSNEVSGITGSRREGWKERNSGSNLSSLKGKSNEKTQNNVLRSSKKSEDVLESKVNSGGLDGQRSEGGHSRVSNSILRDSSIGLQSDGEFSMKRELDHKNVSGNIHETEGNTERNGGLSTIGDRDRVHSNDCSVNASPQPAEEKRSLKVVSTVVDVASDSKVGVIGTKKMGNAVAGINEFSGSLRSSGSVKGGSSSASDVESDSETDSDSGSDSESENEREERKRMRAKILAERAAAKALQAIKERENMVARLEGEKQSLEKILEERAKQQAQEASELQTTMMDIMEAVELEKQKHNNTRMTALARLAKLEAANADLARSFATSQWDLQVEVNRVAQLRQEVGLKEMTHDELRRKISDAHRASNKSVASKGVEFEHEILEAEYSFINDKVERLQEKAKTLQTNIEMTQNEIENPTEVEVELKRRLSQLTDHLIQKQAQVEALSSEKATLLFRIEAVSKLLDENRSISDMAMSADDLESGTWKLSNSSLKPMFEKRIRSGQQHLGSFVRQLDSIFLAGAVFVRRNSTARIWSIVYLVCLHLWVMYILMSHAPPSEEAGAVVSLENINNTGGV